MILNEKKTFTRQMYTTDSEVGKMKLQSIKENLYEATTKAVLYSIEMYTKMSLREWIQTGLLLKLDKANSNLKRQKEELEQGHIGMFDITNGCSVLNDFVRKDALSISRIELQEKLKSQNLKISELEEKESVLERRKTEIEQKIEREEVFEGEDLEEGGDFFNINSEEDNDLIFGFESELEKEYINEYEDEEEENDERENENNSPSEVEAFAMSISHIEDLEEIANIAEEIKDEKVTVQERIDNLNKLTGRDGKLTRQHDEERERLEKLRVLRNSEFAHKNEDEQEISEIGSWEPDAGPLYEWAKNILNYIKIIESRYLIYALFDEFYASKEYKDKFDSCKVYVQKQIKELYVNQSNIVFEFAGDLYDKEDDEFNFKKLIENMAISWDTGIRYLTVVTNEDLHELNIFFKECLSGTDKYVNFYLIDRNALRESCRKKDCDDADYLYFKLLYHLNPSMDKIYWRNRSYTQVEFARQVLYKFIKVKKMFQFNARLKNYEKYIDGINIRKWCKFHLLSEVFFTGADDQEGIRLATAMEDSIIEFCEQADKSNNLAGCTLYYRKAIKASVQLYFYMGKDYVFSYTRSNGQTLHWRTLDDARKYIENTNRFKSYSELSCFVDEMYKSDYFKMWKAYLKTNANKSECEA